MLLAEGGEFRADLDSLAFAVRFVPAPALQYVSPGSAPGIPSITIPPDQLAAVRFVRVKRGAGLVGGALVGTLAGGLTGETIPVVAGGTLGGVLGAATGTKTRTVYRFGVDPAMAGPLSIARQSSTSPWMFGGTILGGALGLGLFGAVGGVAMDDGDLGALAGFVFVGAMGLALGTATGAHLGNGRRGSFQAALLASAAGTGAGFAIWMIDPDEPGYFAIGVLPALVAPIVAESISASRKARDGVSAFVAPGPDGVMFALRVGLGR